MRKRVGEQNNSTYDVERLDSLIQIQMHAVTNRRCCLILSYENKLLPLAVEGSKYAMHLIKMHGSN